MLHLSLAHTGKTSEKQRLTDFYYSQLGFINVKVFIFTVAASTPHSLSLSSFDGTFRFRGSASGKCKSNFCKMIQFYFFNIVCSYIFFPDTFMLVMLYFLRNSWSQAVIVLLCFRCHIRIGQHWGPLRRS